MISSPKIKINVLDSVSKQTSLNFHKGGFNYLLKNCIIRDAQLEYNRNNNYFEANIELELDSIEFKNHLTDLLEKIKVIKIKNTIYRTSNQLYQASCDSIEFNQNLLKINGVNFKTIPSRYEIGHILGFEADWFDLNISQLSLFINSSTFKKNELFKVDSLNIYLSSLLVFRDKRLKFPKLPNRPLLHDIIAEIPFPVELRNISVENMFLSYQEHLSGFDDAATTAFHNMKIQSDLISNIYPDSFSTIKASTSLMNSGVIDFELKMPFSDKHLPYQIKGVIHSLPIKVLNPLFRQQALLEIESGDIQKSTFSFTHDRLESRGQLYLNYKDLKIRLLEDEQKDFFHKIENRIMSRIVNSFVIISDNPKHGKMRMGKIEYVRDPKKSIYNFWWKSMLSGVKSSSGITH
jgi:hypothetical protein